jgi:hypothetical protein
MLATDLEDGPMVTENERKYLEGFRFRIETAAKDGSRGCPMWAKTEWGVGRCKDFAAAAGYTATVYSIDSQYKLNRIS